MEVLVGWFAWYAKVIAHGARTNELPAYIALATPHSEDPRSSLQLAFWSPSSLQLAFFALSGPQALAFKVSFFASPPDQVFASLLYYPPILQLAPNSILSRTVLKQTTASNMHRRHDSGEMEKQPRRNELTRPNPNRGVSIHTTPPRSQPVMPGRAPVISSNT